MKGIESPSTPRENFKLSLLNHPKEFTNWKCGILLSKFKGRYKERRKLLIDVHKLIFLTEERTHHFLMITK